MLPISVTHFRTKANAILGTEVSSEGQRRGRHSPFPQSVWGFVSGVSDNPKSCQWLSMVQGHFCLLGLENPDARRSTGFLPFPGPVLPSFSVACFSLYYTDLT